MNPARQTLSLDQGWRFHLGDTPAPLSNRHIAAYMANKAGWARGAAKPDFDDSNWRQLDLPHDWSIEGEFSKDNHINAGYLPRGVGWYRRHVAIDESQRDRCIQLRFDGISSHATVYVNGHLLHRNFCGYTPMTIDITDVATFGDALNVIAIRVDATSPEGWWYEGAGIYRHAWLTITSPLHVEESGVFVQPKLVDVAADRWETSIETTVANRGAKPRSYRVESIIEDITGVRVGQIISESGTESRATNVVIQAISIDRPARWSLDARNLYRLRTRILTPSPSYSGERAGVRGSSLTLESAEPPLTLTPSPEYGGEGIREDEVETTFGFRTIRFDADLGFFLNEKPVKLKGTCNHQDHAGVGVAVPDSIHEFRIRRLLEMGSNAYRSAHNPPSVELLDACDRLGMLVMDENRNFGSSPERIAQLRSMIRRDRNHPCVILWTLCNEEAIQATKVGEQIARTLATEVRALDSSRPVTAAVSGGVLNLGDCIPNALDVMGINYQIGTYDEFHRLRPTMPLIAAETHCVLSTRGTYETGSNYFDSFDDQKAPWGETARNTWRAVRDRPFVAGLFAWTGFDYRGEPTPLEWPSVTSHWGILDLCGFEKDAFHLHRAFWSDEPFVHLLPHWNLGNDAIGKMTRVMAMSNCDEVELFLDDRSLGRSHVDPIEMAEWSVEYRPGMLRAIAYRNGEQIATTQVATCGPAIALGLEIHPSMQAMLTSGSAPADGQFTLPITVFAVDDAGCRVPDAELEIGFALRGAAKMIGVGNGDPISHEPDHASSRKLFRGKAQVLVQTTVEPGEIELIAEANGLGAATLNFTSVSTLREAPFVSVPTVRRFVSDWRMSPATHERPSEPTRELDAQDMNSWERFDPRQPHARTNANGFVVFRATATIPKAMQLRGGEIRFEELPLHSEVFFDSEMVDVRRAGMRATINVGPSDQAKRTITVVCRVDHELKGLSGSVELVMRGTKFQTHPI